MSTATVQTDIAAREKRVTDMLGAAGGAVVELVRAQAIASGSQFNQLKKEFDLLKDQMSPTQRAQRAQELRELREPAAQATDAVKQYDDAIRSGDIKKARDALTKAEQALAMSQELKTRVDNHEDRLNKLEADSHSDTSSVLTGTEEDEDRSDSSSPRIGPVASVVALVVFVVTMFIIVWPMMGAMGTALGIATAAVLSAVGAAIGVLGVNVIANFSSNR